MFILSEKLWKGGTKYKKNHIRARENSLKRNFERQVNRTLKISMHRSNKNHIMEM